MNNLRDKIEQGIRPVIEESGLELVEFKLAGFGGNTMIKIFVDKERGVSIKECAELSRKISDYLDTQNLIPHRYTLEVSSPGLDRPLTGRADFQRKKGEKVTLFMKDKTDPRDQSSGTISLVEEDQLVFFCQGKEEKVPLNLIDKAILAL